MALEVTKEYAAHGQLVRVADQENHHLNSLVTKRVLRFLFLYYIMGNIIGNITK